MSLDQFLDRKQSLTYDCLNLSYEIWLHLTGKDLSKVLVGFLEEETKVRIASKVLTIADARKFKLLSAPKSPCLVLMQHPLMTPHIGVYWRGSVIHLKRTGVEYMPLSVATQFFKQHRFVTC